MELSVIFRQIRFNLSFSEFIFEIHPSFDLKIELARRGRAAKCRFACFVNKVYQYFNIFTRDLKNIVLTKIFSSRISRSNFF